jgi:hypothetical protein
MQTGMANQGLLAGSSLPSRFPNRDHHGLWGELHARRVAERGAGAGDALGPGGIQCAGRRQDGIGLPGAPLYGPLLYITYGASPQRGKEPVLLESKSPVGLAAQGA